MAKIENELVIFHKIPDAKVVLAQAGTLTVHDVYFLPTDEARNQWGVYARKGNGYIRLYATKMTGKTGVKVYSYHLPFKVTATKLGYLCIPPTWRWPE